MGWTSCQKQCSHHHRQPHFLDSTETMTAYGDLRILRARWLLLNITPNNPVASCVKSTGN